MRFPPFGRLWFAVAAAAMSAAALAIICTVACAQDRPSRVLYFTHSAGYRHDVIPASREILKQLGEMSPWFEVETTEHVAVFAAENLRRYGALIFFTTGELPMNDIQKQALVDFVRNGGGFLGVHSATDTFYRWPEYGKLVGGYFDEHPWHQGVRIDVADQSDPLVAFLGASFTITDEIYQIRDFDVGGSKVLLRLDPASVDLARNNMHRHPYGWPLAWTRSFGNGRVFYTALGHEEAVWRDARYQKLLRNAVLWAIGGSR
jgi:type 1 glutamine amidotransferase